MKRIMLLGLHLLLGLHVGTAAAFTGGGVAQRCNRAPPSRASSVLAKLAPSQWEDCSGCQVLRPEGKPRALLHWLGGVFVSPAPQVAYRYMLESLAAQGYLVVSTPFAVDFDYRKPAAEVHTKFSAAQTELAKDYGDLPQMAAGHSLGALMQVLLCAMYPDYGDACTGAALVSYNNKPASDAIPLFEQAIVPAFAPLEPLTRNQALVSAREQLVGLRRFSFGVAKALVQASPLTQLVGQDEIEAALRDAEALAGLTDQIPDVFSQVSRGASEFSPSPKEMRALIGESYRQRKPLVISFDIDGLDESDALEAALPPAAGATRARLPGTHLTPLAARRLLVPSAVRPDNFLFDVDGLVSEMDRYFTGALAETREEAAARGGGAGFAAEGGQSTPNIVQAAAPEPAFSVQDALEARAEETGAKSRLEEAARATAAAKAAEARAVVTAASALVAPVSAETKEAARAEAQAASEAAQAAMEEELAAGEEANIAAVVGRIAEIEALTEEDRTWS